MVYFLLKFFLNLPGYLPGFLRRGMTGIITFLLRDVLRYRREVITKNLEASFPAADSEWIQSTAAAFYHNLAQVITESTRMGVMTQKEVEACTTLKGFQHFKKFADQGRHQLCVVSHFSNWEYGATTGFALRELGIKPYTIYQRVKNPAVNKLMKERRARFGFDLLEMKEAPAFFNSLKPDDPPVLVILIADQAPHPKRAIWNTFLHQPTPWYPGPELLARRYNLPVTFGAITRSAPGQYEIEISELCAEPGETNKGEITALHSKKLEMMIQHQPADWLWSHRRWKHKLPEGAKLH